MKSSNFTVLLAMIFLLQAHFSFAQYPNNPYGCGSSWYDSGGLTGNYNSNENYNYTFIPTTGYAIRIHFTSFNTESNDDILTITNNGVNTRYSGTPSVPFDITSNAVNGQLTANFTSSANYTLRPGWAAEIQCIGPPQTITATVTQSQICAGNTVTFQYISHSGGRCDGGSDNWQYQWRDGPNYNTSNAITSWSTTSDYTASLSTSVIYYLYMRCSAYPSGISRASNPVIVSVFTQPIGGSAIASGEVCSGNSTTVLLSGASGNLIQWQQSPDGIGFWSDISGATSTILSTPSLSATMFYRARVSQSGIGCNDAYSSVDTVIVHPVPLGGNATATPSPICSDNTSTVQLTAYTGNIQWQQSLDGNNFTDVSSGSGVNDPTYFTSALTTTTYFRAKLSQNGVGCINAFSTKDTVVVNPSPSGGTAIAASPLCINNSSTVNLTGYTGNIQWQKSTNGVSWVNIPSGEGSGQNSPTYITPVLTNTIYYRARLSQTGSGCITAYSIPDTMIVLPNAVGGNAASQYPVICSGSTSVLRLTGHTGNIHWQESQDGLTNWTDVSAGNGMATAIYTTPPLHSTTFFRARLSSGIGCPVVFSTVDTVIVNPSPVGGLALAYGPLCSGNSSTVNLSGQTGNIQWQQSPNGNTGWVNVSTGSGMNSPVYNSPVMTTTTYYRARLSQTGTGCTTTYSSVDTLIVLPNSVAGTALAVSPICYNNSTTVTLSGSVGNIQWQQSPDGNIGWVDVTGGTGSNSLTYYTPDLNSQIFYRAAVSQNGIGCQTVYSVKDTVLIDMPTVGGTAIANANPVCQGSISSISLAGSYGSIQWQQSLNGNSNWVPVTGGSGANNNLYTTPNLFTTTYYRAMVQSGACLPSYSTVTVVNVDIPPNPGILTLLGSNNLCAGANTGKLRLSSYSGSIIRWEASPDGISSWYMIANTTDTLRFNNLSSTTYFRAILQNGSCANIPSNMVMVNIVPSPVADFNFDEVCFNTTIHFSDLSVISSGNITSWNWNFGPSSSTNQNPAYTYTTPGSYNVRLVVSSNFGCKDTVYKTVNQSAALQSIIDAHENISCFGNSDGTAHVQVSGGTLPYYYSWNTVPQQSSAYVSGLSAGTYSVSITDAIGCTSRSSVIIIQPPALSANIASYSNISCNGRRDGSIDLTVSGGTGTYSYTWNTTPAQHTQDIANLYAGPYHVIVSDANHCTADAFVTLTEPLPLSASSIVFNHVRCYDGSDGKATINVSGGTTPYTYNWTGNYTTQTVSSLSAGNYSVLITDANNCTTVTSVVITQPQSLQIQLSSNAATNNCYGSVITLYSDVTGGTPQYFYNWWSDDQPGSILSPNSPSTLIMPDETAVYSMNVSDANNCVSNTETITIRIMPKMIVDAGQDLVIYKGDSVQLNPTFSGNSFDYVLWSPAATLSNPHIINPYAKPLITTTYTVIFTDQYNCKASDSLDVLVITTSAPDSTGNLIIPRAFTPNGDGVNDTWEIGNIEFYPKCYVAVFDRSGHLIFESKGYKEPWDGKDNDGNLKQLGTYTYVIKLTNGRELISGTVTIIH